MTLFYQINTFLIMMLRLTYKFIKSIRLYLITQSNSSFILIPLSKKTVFQILGIYLPIIPQLFKSVLRFRKHHSEIIAE